MRITLLGRLRVKVHGKSVDLSTRPEQILLAALALHPDRDHQRARLAGLIWPDSEESQARSNLRNALWRLKQSIGEEYLLADKETIALARGSPLEIDVHRFQNELNRIETSDSLAASLEEYQGPLLPGFYEDWIIRERDRLAAAFDRRAARLLELLLQEGRYEAMRLWAERWIAQGGVPEPAYRALMNACAGLGDQAGMAEAYQRCVEALEKELGVHPSQETTSLYERLASGQRPPGSPRGVPNHNLPSPISSFIGRVKELDEIGKLLLEPAHRLITLVGPPGVGKTRLALECAWESLGDFEEGVWWVDLVPVESDDRVPDAVARAVGVEELGEELPRRIDRLATSLDRGPLLLVIDNCEHLLEGTESLARALLQRCPDLKVISTSRRGLNIPGETVWEVPSFEVGADGGRETVENPNSAMRLFAERAAQARRDFRLTSENLATVRQICRRLDGVALAIELAAARMKTLTSRDLLEQLDRRFEILRRDAAAEHPKHKTLEASLRWSLDLLSDQESLLFDVLSVFRGGFRIEPVQAICAELDMSAAAVQHGINRLVEHSLVTVQRTEEGRMRYGLLETMRQYGEKQLIRRGILAEVTAGHVRAVRDLCLEWGPRFEGTDDFTYLLRMDEEFENLRVAVDRAINRSDPEMVAELIAPLYRYIYVRGHVWPIARKAVEYVLKHEGKIAPAELQWVLFIAAVIREDVLIAHRVRSSIEYFNRSLDLAVSREDPLGIVRSAGDLARQYRAAGQMGAAHKVAQICDNAAASSKDAALEVTAASMTAFTKPYKQRVASLRDNCQLAKTHCGWLPQVFAHFHLAIAFRGWGDWREALKNYQLTLQMAERAGRIRWEDFAILHLAACQAELGSYEQCLQSLDMSARATRQIKGEEVPVPIRESRKAEVLALSGRIDQARDLVSGIQIDKPPNDWRLVDIQALINRASVMCKIGEADEANLIMSQLAEQVGEDSWYLFSFNSMYKLSVTLGMCVWAELEHRLGRHEEARVKFRDTLLSFKDDERSPGWFEDKYKALVNFAYLLADVDEFESAGRILRRTEALREQSGAPVHPIEEPRREEFFSKIGRALGSDWLSSEQISYELEDIEQLIAEAAEIASK